MPLKALAPAAPPARNALPQGIDVTCLSLPAGLCSNVTCSESLPRPPHHPAPTPNAGTLLFLPGPIATRCFVPPAPPFRSLLPSSPEWDSFRAGNPSIGFVPCFTPSLDPAALSTWWLKAAQQLPLGEGTGFGPHHAPFLTPGPTSSWAPGFMTAVVPLRGLPTAQGLYSLPCVEH